MIKLFRNIRKRLAAKNKVATYLRYAIGEILLVVIQEMNNWAKTVFEERTELIDAINLY